MPYIKRDEQGVICAVSETPCDGFEEQLQEGAAELNRFFDQWQSNKNDLDETDLGFIRVLEDVIDLLISKKCDLFY